jgi:hypothetical protein
MGGWIKDTAHKKTHREQALLFLSWRATAFFYPVLFGEYEGVGVVEKTRRIS